MDSKKLIITSGVSLMFAIITFSNFLRSAGAEDVKTVHIVFLLACGMLIGISVTGMIRYLKEKNKSKGEN
jgi:hypothetical protein